MKHWLVFYDLAADYLERRSEFRGAHLKLAWEAQERGELVLGGALGDPPTGAVLFFQGETGEAAERFAKSDPYVANGLITKWSVEPWTTVVGDDATTPVRPDST